MFASKGKKSVKNSQKLSDNLLGAKIFLLVPVRNGRNYPAFHAASFFLFHVCLRRKHRISSFLEEIWILSPT